MPEFSPLLLLGVSLVGGLGAACRYLADTLLRERRGWSAPGATFDASVLAASGNWVWLALAAASLVGGFAAAYAGWRLGGA